MVSGIDSRRTHYVQVLSRTDEDGRITPVSITWEDGRTFEAFFPLISTALIYFALAYLLACVVRLILMRTDPRVRGGRRREGQAR